MAESIFIFVGSLFLVIRGSTLATKHATRLAQSFHISRYVIGFIVVALISILPETLIAINSALAGIPEFGLGTLFGSNVADLTLIFAILIFHIGRGVRVSTKVLSTVHFYPLFILLPLIFGLNGYYSRLEGIFLIVAGAFFYYKIFKGGVSDSPTQHTLVSAKRSLLLLIFSIGLLLVGSHFTVSSASSLALALGISPVLIGMLVVGLGTTMPELFFSLKSVEREEDSLAVGDLLGTVLADATIVVGILAVISPFAFPTKIVYITGGFMFLGAMMLINFMHTNKKISVKEGLILTLLWLTYVIVEFTVSS
ncbi:MAG TPA: hypothetical protein PLD99_01770 [Parcubacteria group bacterium]|nr:hypothetical protein [Parcubacteria group bacterium]